MTDAFSTRSALEVGGMEGEAFGLDCRRERFALARLPRPLKIARESLPRREDGISVYGSLLAASKESFVLDNDLIGSVMRATRGIEVNEDTLAFEVVRDVCLAGPGHFLGHDQTLNRMQSDYHYPALADRRTPQEWRERGAVDLLHTARRRTRDILGGPHPGHLLGRTVDAEIRRRFPIRLTRPEVLAPAPTIVEGVGR